MGAVTALLHLEKDSKIAGVILDSPFSSLRVVAYDLMKAHTRIPSFIITMGLSFIRKTVKRKANFNIDDLKPIKLVNKLFTPAFFFHG